MAEKVLIRYEGNGSSRYDGKEYFEAASKLKREKNSRGPLKNGEQVTIKTKNRVISFEGKATGACAAPPDTLRYLLTCSRDNCSSLPCARYPPTPSLCKDAWFRLWSSTNLSVRKRPMVTLEVYT